MAEDTEDIDEEQLRQLEEDLLFEQQRVEKARVRFKEKKRLDILKRQEELKKKLESVDESIQQNRQKRIELRSEIATKQIDRSANVKEAIQVRKETWELEREHQLEEAARRRIEMEKTREKRETMEKLLDIHLIQLDEIEAEKQRRGESEEKKLANLLARGEHLKKALSEGKFELKHVAQEFTTQIEAREAGEAAAPYRLVDEIEVVRRRQRETQELVGLNTIRHLNEERHQLHAEEERLRKQKQELVYFRSKGAEFLAELELGNLPPVQYLLQNAELDDLSDEEEVDDIIEKTIQDAREMVSHGQEKLDELRNGLGHIRLEKDYAVVQPVVYDGSLGPSTYRSSQRRAFNIVSELVREMVGSAVEISAAGRTLEQVQSLYDHWAAVDLALRTEQDEKQIRVALHLILNELISEAMTELFTGIMKEIGKVQKLVQKSIKTALADVVLSYCGQPDALEPQREMFTALLEEIQRLRSKEDEKDSTVRLPRRSQKLLHPIDAASVVSGGKKAATNNRKAIAPEDQTMPSEDEIGRPNADAIVLKVRRLPTLETSPKRLSVEKQYWKSVHVKLDFIKYPHNVNRCSIVSLSGNGRFLAAASDHGELYVWDISNTSAPILLRRIPSMPKVLQSPLVALHFNWNQTELLSLNQQSVVQVWSVLPNRVRFQEGTKHSSTMFDSSKYQSRPVYPSIRITSDDLERPVYKLPSSTAAATKASGKAKKKKKNALLDANEGLRPTCASFFPGISLLSHQPSLVVGTANGTVMKWNSETGRQAVDLIHGNTEAVLEPPTTVMTSADKDKSSSSTFVVPPKSVRREFFHAHQEEILYIGFVNNMDLTIVTVSKNALVCLWPYTRSSFVGYCWYIPSHKFRIDSRIDTPGTKGRYRFAALEQVRSSHHGGELVLQFFYPPEEKSQKPLLRFYIFDVKLFDLSSVYIETLVRGTNRIQFAVTPFFRGIKSDFLLLLMDNVVTIYSLITGQSVTHSIGLIGRNEPAHPITTLSLAGQERVKVAATGIEHNRIFLIEFTDYNTSAVDRSVRKAGVPSRYRKVPRDTMIPQIKERMTSAELSSCVAWIIDYVLYSSEIPPVPIRPEEDEIVKTTNDS